MTVAAATTPDLHNLLLRLAGRLPDDGLARMRSAVSPDEQNAAITMLAWPLSSGHLALDEEEVLVARQLLASIDADLESHQAGLTPRQLPPLGYTFSSPDPEDIAQISFDHMAIAGAVLPKYRDGRRAAKHSDLDVTGGVKAMWRVDRRSPGGTVPVRLVETSHDAQPAAVHARMATAIVEFGGAPPRLEVFVEGTTLTGYHEAALAEAVLVWATGEAAPPAVAAVFDGVDDRGNPQFADDHPVLAENDREELLAYLSAGQTILDGFEQLDDVRGGGASLVPIGFRSDGAWVWTDATIYYLRTYGLQPDPALCAHVRAAPHKPLTLTRLDRSLALDALADTYVEEEL